MAELVEKSPSQKVWPVGALCRAVADALVARFGTLGVRGELSGFSRAASGHCYFSLKDSTGQLRCAMFKRAASGLTFAPRDGELVELSARISVYEPRGDLQLIVEDMRRAGQGSLFEEFLRLKAKLEAQGLFDARRKRALPLMPRAIGLVTSIGAAALHDVVTTLRRRAPYLPVVLVPAAVQGSSAPLELCDALSKMYLLADSNKGLKANLTGEQVLATPPVDVIVLVRGGGALEDLWAFNDEQLALTLARSPVPVVCGVGHETDFTIADFVADVRAPTPTAAAELVAQPREAWSDMLDALQRRLMQALQHLLDRQGQRLDSAVMRLGRPSHRLATQQLRLTAAAHRLRGGGRTALQVERQRLQRLGLELPSAVRLALTRPTQRLDQLAVRLGLLNPHLVLARGYAWLTDERGQAVTGVAQTHGGQHLQATLVDGTVDLQVLRDAG